MTLDKHCWRILSQKKLKLSDGQRSTKQIALHLAASQSTHKLGLHFGLDPFGNDIEAKPVGNGDDGANDGGAIVEGFDFPHERLVDFQGADGEMAKVTER